MFFHAVITIVLSLGLILGLSVSLYLVLTNRFLLNKTHSTLSSLLISPFLLSLILYGSFSYFPEKPGWFYVLVLTSIVFASVFSTRRLLFHLVNDWKIFIDKVKKISFTPTSRILLAFFSFIFILCILRIFFWPINWDDQIYYIEQSYAIGQSRSMKDFINWGQFDNGVIRYDYNPAIRPGLPLIYSFASLLSSSLNDALTLSRVMTFYFMIVSLGVFMAIVKHINQNNFLERSLIVFLLIFSSYQYASLTIMGFKELPILCLVLLVIDFIASKEFRPNYLSFAYLGVLTGVMSFINLSGSFITCILALMIFIITKTNVLKRVGLCLCALFILTIVSGLEFPYFFAWTITGGTQSTNIIKPIKDYLNHKSTPKTELNGYLYQTSEFKSYGIDNKFDELAKGKLQGFFQPQFYGFIFWVFLLMVAFRMRVIWNQKHTRFITIFLLLYYLIFIDILDFNGQQYSYVTTVSHKYTVILIPFISVIIASQWGWIKTNLNLISLRRFFVFNLLIFLASALVIKNHYEDIFRIGGEIIPIHNSPSYYLEKIAFVNNTYGAISLAGLMISSIAALFFKDRARLWWHRHHFGSIAVIIYIFIAPSLIFFDTNMGLLDTLKYSLAPKDIKLSKIKGWQDLYGMVNALNKLPSDSKVLFFGPPYQLMAIHLNIPSNQIIFLANTPTHMVNSQDIKDASVYYRADYVLLSSDDFQFPKKFLIFSTNNLFLYNPKFSN